MEPLSWSGALGPILNPIMLAAHRCLRARVRRQLHPHARRRARWRGADQPRPHADDRPHAGGLRADGDEIRRAPLRGLLRGLHHRRHGDADAGGQGHHRGMASRLTPVWIASSWSSRVDLLQAQAGPLRQALRQPHRHGGLRAGDVLDLRGGLRGRRGHPWAHRRHQPDAQRGAGLAAPLAGGRVNTLLPAGRRQPRAGRVQPDDLRRAGGAQDHARRDALRLHGRRHAGPARGLFRRQARHRDHLHRQPRAGLPGDPAVLPAGDARNRRRGRAAIHVDGAVRLPHPVLRGAVQLALSHAGAETEPAGGGTLVVGLWPISR
jgi:hypothetical protein